MTHVDIINATTTLTNEAVAAIIPPLQIQVSRDLATAWGIIASVFFVPRGASPTKGHWWLVLLDNSDVAGALGYHDITTEGLPIGKVFVTTTQQAGLSWTVTTSHELAEMLVDPDVNLAAQVSDTRFYAYEVGDPVEADALGYLINGVLLSDFVTPAWFEALVHPVGTLFDHAGHLTGPLQLAAGGYISVLDVRSSGWMQLTAHASYRQRPKVGSRRERRTLPRAQWLRSTAYVGLV